MGMTVPLLSSDMADFSGVFVRRSSEEPRHYSWHFPSTFAVTIIICLEIKCAVEGRGRHGRDRASIARHSPYPGFSEAAPGVLPRPGRLKSLALAGWVG